MKRLRELELRRERLLAQAALQRDGLDAEVRALMPAFAVVDGAAAAARWLRANPGPVLAAAAVLVVLRPRRALAWAWRGVALWRGYRRLSAWLARIGA